ncbi:Bud-site selection protein [Xylariaceae sp. FL0804]|nr:Bud-site selection protein [Xylariaceae sp. FL0804]
MPKRKRNEPSLEENIAKWEKELARGLKTAKGFERQRQSKRLREAQKEGNHDKTARLEREAAVLKSLDLHQAARAHLCSSLLKIKGIAESPRLPSTIRPVPRPELADDEMAAVHNVTSNLFNRKQARDVIEEAVMGTCIALRVPMPDKKGGGGKRKGGSKGSPENEDDDDGGNGKRAGAEEKAVDRRAANDGAKRQKAKNMADEGDGSEDSVFEEPVLLKRKPEDMDGDEDLDEDGAGDESSESPGFEGFSDTDDEERMFSRYDEFVAGSSDEDEDGSDSGEELGEENGLLESRSRAIRKQPPDDVSVSSEASDQSEESEDSEDEPVSPPPKKAKTKAAKAAPINTGSSAFLPALMGGYISGSESASDVDVAPARKNRRGQRARQAIWDKKYGEKAKHHEKQQTKGRDQGWDMKRGAVAADDDRGGKPWKQGVRNPFEKSHVHPERQRQMNHGGGNGERDRDSRPGGGGGFEEKKPRPAPKRDDAGTLHPSWAAAKKAKEESQKVAFQGKKVVFD